MTDQAEHTTALQSADRLAQHPGPQDGRVDLEKTHTDITNKEIFCILNRHIKICSVWFRMTTTKSHSQLLIAGTRGSSFSPRAENHQCWLSQH